MLAEQPVAEPWRLVRELRETAVRYYSTDAAEARAIAARAVELAELMRDDRSRGWAYRALAEALAFSGRLRESEEAYQKATTALRRARDGATLGQLLVGRLQVLSHLGRHDAVRGLAEEARRHLQEAKDDSYLARLSVSLGVDHLQHDDYQGALTEFDRAIALLPVRDELAVSLRVNRAVVITNLGREEEGLAIYAQLEEESRERGFELLEAQIQMNAAHVHVQRGEFDRALARLAPAAQYFRRTGHPTFLATSQLHRAEAYQQMNLRREALELAEEAAQIFGREGLGYDEALAHGQVAIAQIAMGRTEEASRRLRSARRLFEKERNESRVAVTRLLWAESLFLKRQFRQAARHVEAALETFRTLRLVRWQAAATVLRTQIALQRPPARTAARNGSHGGSAHQEHVDALRKLIRRLSPTLYPLQSYRLYEALGEVLEREGKIRQAESTYRSAIHCLEDLRLRVPTEDSKIAFLEDKIHLYDRLLLIELARKSPAVERLFEWMERARAQSLWDRLSADSAPSAGVSESWELDKLRRHLYWLHARVSQLELGKPRERARADALRKQLVEVEQEWTRRLREVRESAPVQGAPRDRQAESRESGLLRLRASLPRDWGYLSYHVGRDFALAVVVTESDLRFCRLDPGSGAKLAQLCARLDFQWGAAALSAVRRVAQPSAHGAHHPYGGGGNARNGSAPGDGAPVDRSAARSDLLLRTTHTILAEMHELLWAPIERLGLGPVKGWVVSPHGPIHRVPIHALLGPDGFLVERCDLSITPSARVWRKLAERSRRSDANGSAWIGGVPSTHLPAVERELAEVARILAEHEPIQVVSPTVQMFREQTRGARLLHLAAHGSLRRDNPTFSFIQMADGPLFVHDLVDLDLSGAHVVLTACSSGRAGAPVGDEWIGLARGFLQAGAASVVASLWPIEDGPTLELMRLYYGRLAAGEPPALALGSAMRKFMTLRPHPWHWAPFAVLGGHTVDLASERVSPGVAESRKRGHP